MKKVKIIFCAALMIFCQTAGADSQADSQTDSADSSLEEPDSEFPGGSLGKVLSGDDFGGHKIGWTISPRKISEDNFLQKLLDKLKIKSDIKTLSSQFIRVCAVLFILALLIIVILRLRKNPPDLSRFSRRETRGEIFTKGGGASELLEASRAAYSSGDYRAAWSFVYRAAVFALRDSGLMIPASATEYECARIIGRQRDDILVPFNRLVTNRINAAYRGINEKNGFEECADFCAGLIVPKKAA